MPRRSIAVLFAAAVLWPSPQGRADSLWERRTRNHAFLVADSPYYEVGDLLTIIINESTDVDNRESRNLKKSSNASVGANVNGQSSEGFADQAASASLEASSESEREFDGEAKFTSAREFTDRISVTVREVQPNGNLLVAGEREVGVDGDARKLSVSGIVRRRDIRPDGTIDSRSMAFPKVHYVGSGVEQRFTHQGWLSRRLNKLWPF
jgi:flagellar L-ring protein precursor FlgH